MTQSRHHQFFHRAQVSCCLCLTYSVHSTTGLWSLLQFPSIHLFCFIIYVYFTNGICHSAHQSQCLWSSSRLTSTNSVSLWSALEKPPVDRTYSKSRRGHWDHSVFLLMCWLQSLPQIFHSLLSISVLSFVVLSSLSHPLRTHHRYLCSRQSHIPRNNVHVGRFCRSKANVQSQCRN